MDPALALEVAALSRMRDLEDLESKGNSAVQRVYSGGTAFVTGASGFLGKHLTEKLMRSTDFKKVYLLLRPKKGKSVKQRLGDVLADPLFEHLRKTKPDFSTKVQIVEGDITAVSLGMSQEDWQTLGKEVNFIFHVAATTRFDETLSTATLTNVRGTREVIALAKTCRNLRALVHISTAYSHATRSRVNKDVYEQYYDVPMTPGQLIELVENRDEERLKELEESAMREWPNTYTLTKAAAEDLIRTECTGLPACIVRPAVVLTAYREPTPGWVDITAAYGPSGVIVGIGLGLIHAMLAKRETVVDVVPADYVNNAIMAAGWATVTEHSAQGNARNLPRIYTVCSRRNPATWGYIGDVHRTESRKLATPKAVWYCYSVDIPNKALFYLYFWLVHWIPAYIIDGICFLTGKPRQFIRLYNKAYKLFTLNGYFSCNEWIFSDKNLQDLQKRMSADDRIIYNFDVMGINWKDFFLIWSIGLRKYIIKDGLTGTDYAIRKQNWLYIANIVFIVVYAYLWLKLFSLVFSGIQYLF